MSFNQIILLGRLSRDIELRYTQSGLAIAKTAIATTKKFTKNGEKKEEVCFMDLDFFGRSAEVANQFLNKGSQIQVTGRVVMNNWTDHNNVKRISYTVSVDSMIMLDTKTNGHPPFKKAEDGNKPEQQPSSRPHENGQQKEMQFDENGDEIPF